MNYSSYILLSRSILDSDVFASQKLLKVWIWCLCKANYKDRFVPLKVGKGETVVKVKRGQFLFGRFKAEEEIGIDGSTIYKSIHKLKNMEMIEIESNNQYSVITICKYDIYQDPHKYERTSKEQVSNNQVTSKEQVSNTTKKDKKDKKDKNIILPFKDLDFLNKWNDWKKYKSKEFKFKYKSEQSEQAALSKLNNLANNKKSIAIKIINESMSNGWSGLFALKNNDGQQQKPVVDSRYQERKSNLDP